MAVLTHMRPRAGSSTGKEEGRKRGRVGEGREGIAQDDRLSTFGSLNENGLHRLIGSGTVRRCGLGGSVSLWEGFEVSNVQAKPSVTLSSCCLQIKR